MGFLILIICVLVAVFFVQIGKARELASVVRGEKAEEYEVNTFQAGLGMAFMVVFLLVCIVSFIYYIPWIMGWGPNTAASEHGPSIDYMFNITLFFCAIVFFATQFLLFWYSWKYRGKKGARAKYWSHDERLEMVWMLIPAVVMTFLVVGGLQAWNKIMPDIPADQVVGKDYIEIEATGMQFAWLLRYPGRDHKLGAKHFTKIDGVNPLGQDWTDEKNIDDFHPSEIVLPVGQKVRVRINSRDVLHNFYLPHFRVKMDAVPGMPTYFIFTPVVTSDSMRARYKQHAHWNIPDKKQPEKKRYEAFEYELACAELCGRGHYSMRRVVKIVTQEQYDNWFDEQEATSHYLVNVRNKENDPFKGKVLDFEKILAAKEGIKEILKAVNTELEKGDNTALTTLATGLKEQLAIARKTLDVSEAEDALRSALRLSSSMMAPAIEEETTVEDSTATPAIDSTQDNS